MVVVRWIRLLVGAIGLCVVVGLVLVPGGAAGIEGLEAEPGDGEPITDHPVDDSPADDELGDPLVGILLAIGLLVTTMLGLHRRLYP